ncbi:MAG: ABC transporter substrate-binding protein [Anaerolineales bacterium]
MLQRILFPLIIFALLLAACAPQADPSESPAATSLTKIRLPMGFIPNVQYAPLYVAASKGYFAEAGFEVEFDYSYETDGIALVGAGQLPFTLASGEQVLLARSQGLPVVYALGWFQEYPISLVAKSSTGIEGPDDFRNRKIGLPGLFGANYIGLLALLYEVGIAESEVQLESIGFNQVEVLLADQVDIIVGYTANEPVVLRAQGYEVDEWRTSDYVQLASNGLVTNEKTIAENPEMVRAFVEAMLKGIRDTINDPEAAYEICFEYVENLREADQEAQKQVLATSIEIWRADRLGYSDPQAWEKMQEVLVKMGMYAAPLDLDAAFTNQFIP